MTRDSYFRKEIFLLIISTIAYASNSTFAFITVLNSSPTFTLIMAGIGTTIGTLLFYTFFKKSLMLDDLRNIGWPNFVSASSLVMVGIFLYFGYKIYGLARIYPLTAAGAIVFLAIDLLRYESKLSRKEVLELITGVFIVFFGTFLAQSNGFSFQTSTLPFIIGIIFFGGIGYYASLYRPEKYSTSSKGVLVGLFSILFGILLIPACKTSCMGSSYLPIATGIACGILFSIALIGELSAVRIANTSGTKRNLLYRNFANNFTQMDVVIILLISIALKSYTLQGLLGGVFIVAGVIILERIK